MSIWHPFRCSFASLVSFFSETKIIVAAQSQFCLSTLSLLIYMHCLGDKKEDQGHIVGYSHDAAYNTKLLMIY